MATVFYRVVVAPWLVVFVAFDAFEFELVVHGGCASAVERLCAERWAVDGSAHGVRVALMPRRRCAGVDVHFPRELMVRYVSAVDDGGVAWVTPGRGGEAARTGCRLGESARRRGGGQEEEI